MTSHLEQFNDSVARAADEDFLLMPRWGYIVSALVLFLIGFFGFFLNLLVILLMFKDRQLWTPLNIILFNLVCSDFSVSVLGNPFTLISALFHRWVFGRTMCVLYGFFMALLGISSITTLTVISFERYLMVTRPLRSRHLSSRGACGLIVLIWTYSLALTTPPLIGWGSYVNEAANISCSVNWHEQSANTLTYILFLFAMGQILPLAVITFSYVNIIRTLKQNSQRLGRVSRAESRATAMVFIMIVAFTIAWTPYSLFALLEQFATEGIISPGLGVIPALIAKSSICYDPLIYVGMNSQRPERNTVITETRNDATRSDINNRNYTKIPELSTIQENKSTSGVEKSGETVCEDDLINDNCKMTPITEPCTLTDHPLILTIVDSDGLLLSQAIKRNNNIDDLWKICDVDDLEMHSTDAIRLEDTIQISRTLPTMKHSYSLDLSYVAQERKRQKIKGKSNKAVCLPPPDFLVDMMVVTKFLAPEAERDSFKNCICMNEKNNADDANL
ncbi:unnamed protein product, partial [Iphiclides podalirius]